MKNKLKIANGKWKILRTLNSQISTFNFNYFNSGQALVTLLMFMIIAITITTGAVTLVILNSVGTNKLEQSVIALSVAESGAENATLRLLRNPSYAGETLAVDGGTATITVTGSEPKTITVVGSYNNFERTLEVIIGYTNNILTIQSWKEVY